MISLSILMKPVAGRSTTEFRVISVVVALIEPFNQTNNQHSWTDYYMIGETEYHVTTWPGSDDPEVDMMLPEDD